MINPSRSPQRLRIAMVAGPGNRSPARTISLFLNGERIEQFAITGAAQLLTKPFVIPGPWSQIEILVDEDADPIPRRGALWNRWVPGEPRRLNVAVISIALARADSETNSLASSVDLGPPNGDTRLFNGIFMDRWMGREATVTLASPVPAAKELSVRGMAPGGVGLPFPFHITPTFNGVRLPSCEIIGPGRFQAHCPVPEPVRRSVRSGQAIHIELRSERTFVGKADPRQISLQLDRVELVPESQGQ